MRDCPRCHQTHDAICLCKESSCSNCAILSAQLDKQKGLFEEAVAGLYKNTAETIADRNKIIKLEAENVRLREALKKYGKHDAECPVSFGWSKIQCNCTIQAILTEKPDA